MSKLNPQAAAKPLLRNQLLIGLVAALFFIPFLGNVHLFDWDEINFAECAREMLINHEYGRVYINFQPFWEKPPFFIWLQVLSMQVFGVGEFAARFPDALCGIITLVLLYRIGTRLKNNTFGLIWAGLYIGSILPQFYFHSGIIDPWFNLFIFLGLYNLVRYLWKHHHYATAALPRSQWYYLLSGGLLAGMAVLTKGPVGLLIIGLCFFVYWALQRFRLFFNFWHISVFVAASTLVSLLWAGSETLANGPWFITEFIIYNYRLFSTPDAGHGGFPGYHFVVLFFGCFPVSLFAVRAMYRPAPDEPQVLHFRTWMLVLFWVVLILFSLVKSKIVHYSSLCYFPLTFLGALTVYNIITEKIKLPAYIKVGTVITGLIIALVPAVLPFLAQRPQILRSLLSKDPFAVANTEAQVHWTGFEWLVGPFLAVAVLLALYFWNREKWERGFAFLFGGTACTVVLILWAFIGRIELFSQGAAVSFLESLADKDCYVLTIGYRSYAQYFYARLQPENKPQFYYRDNKDRGPDEWRDFLLTQPQKKDVYVITKITETHEAEKFPLLQRVGAANGFVFYYKKASV